VTATIPSPAVNARSLWRVTGAGPKPDQANDRYNAPTKEPSMHKPLSLLAVAIALSIGVAHAQDKPKSAQQEKMAMCNQQAEGKKGDERKAFMKGCLSNKPETQQSKMKTCNAAAADKKGDERKAFMSECLKKKA
jgi:uncharacterized protein HemX